MRVRRWVWAMVLVGCTSPGKPTTTPEPTPVQAAARAPDPALIAVADEVDPGPQKPLFDAIPGWLRDLVGVPADKSMATRQIREVVLAWDKLRPTSGEELMTGLLSLGRALILAEQAVAAGSEDPELLLALSRAYVILANPAFVNEHGMFQQILAFMAMGAAQVKSDSSIDTAAVMTTLREVFTRAPALHRRTAAELLRRHGEHPEMPRVLGRLADDAANNQHHDVSLRLRKMAMARLGKAATGDDFIDLATTCYRSLEPTCGDEAMVRARALGSGKPGDKKAALTFTGRVEFLTTMGTQARRVLVLTEDPRVKDPSSPDLSAALERGHLLVLLMRYADARTSYEALRAAHPGDARPLAGLAKVTMSDGGDMSGSMAWIDKGRKLANRDGDFYEVALGVFGARMMSDMVPQILRDGGVTLSGVMKGMLDDMREYATGMRAFYPARADVVLDLEAVVRMAVPLFEARDELATWKAARELAVRTKVLLEKYPDSPDVRRMAYLSANLGQTRDSALALARGPLVGKLASDAALQRSRVQAWFDVTVLWDAREEVTALLAAVRGLPVIEGDTGRKLMLAMTLALQFRANSDAAALTEAATLLTEVVVDESVPAATRLMALCNLGVMETWMGDGDAANTSFKKVLESDPKNLTALQNLAAMYTIAGASEAKLVEIFDTVARDGENTTLRLQAAAWRYTQAKAGLGDVEVSRQAFVELVKTAKVRDVRGGTPLGRLGAFSRGNWNISLQYQASVGFSLINQMDTTAWLILSSPDIDELMLAVNAPVKTKPGKNKTAPQRPATP